MSLNNAGLIQSTLFKKPQSLVMMVFMFLMLTTSSAWSQTSVCPQRGSPELENCVCAKGSRLGETEWNGRKYNVCMCPDSNWMEVVNGNCACPEGTTLKNGQCTCNNAGEELDHTGCSCPPGHVLQKGRCTASLTKPLCPEGSSFAGGHCSKLGTCASGYTMTKYKRGWACQAEPTCPTGTRALGIFCVGNETPVACPPGSTLKNRTCVVEACPEGTISNFSGHCIPKEIAAKTPVCPPNSEKDSSRAECYVNPTCPSESKLVFVSSGGRGGQRCIPTATPICPDGSSAVVVPPGGGVRCRLNAPPECPTGTVLLSNMCAFPMVCPSGSSLIKGQCDAGTGCPSGSTNFVELCATSQPRNTCPEGGKQIGSEFKCSAENITCPTGYSAEGVLCTIKPTCQKGYTLSEKRSAFGHMTVTCLPR